MKETKLDGLGRITEQDSNRSGGQEEADGWHPAARLGVAELPTKAALGVRPRGVALGLGRGRRRRSAGGARLGHAGSRPRLK
jgi:hypothetical protein